MSTHKICFYGKIRKIILEITNHSPLTSPLKSQKYRIQPNYRTVRIGFSKMLGKLVKYVSTYTKGTLLKKLRKDLSNNAYAKFLYVFFLNFLYKAYVVGTHLNCIDKSMQFKWVPTTYAHMKK